MYTSPAPGLYSFGRIGRPVASSILCGATLYLVFGAGVGALDTTATATLPTGRGAKGDRLATTGLAASCFRFGAAGALAGFAAAACLRGAGALATFFATDAVLAIDRKSTRLNSSH